MPFVLALFKLTTNFLVKRKVIDHIAISITVTIGSSCKLAMCECRKLTISAVFFIKLRKRVTLDFFASAPFADECTEICWTLNPVGFPVADAA